MRHLLLPRCSRHPRSQFIGSGIAASVPVLNADEEAPMEFHYTPDYYRDDPRRLRQWKMDSQRLDDEARMRLLTARLKVGDTCCALRSTMRRSTLYASRSQP